MSEQKFRCQLTFIHLPTKEEYSNEETKGTNLYRRKVNNYER